MKRGIDRFGALAALASLLIGCASDEEATDCATTVAPGDGASSQLQTALIEQPAGSILCLEAGTYRFNSEVSIATSGVTLRGAGREATILDFSGQDLGGNGLQITGDDVTVAAFTVMDTPGDAIRATSVRNISFLDVGVHWSTPSSLENGAYGLYPVGCDGVRIERCVVSGARDAGIYVGQSTRIRVADSEAYGNVAGIEIENSTEAEVVGNHAHDNTGGILIFNLPGLPVQDGRRAKVHQNRVVDNNLPNFAEKGTVVEGVPYGTGIIVLASDENEIHDNVIENNDTMGVIFISYLDFLFGAHDDPAFNAYPEANYLHDNQMANNGNNPDPLLDAVVEPMPVPDILWDGCPDPESTLGDEGLNCVMNNGDATYYNIDFCSDPSMPSGDISEVTCEHETLPTQSF